MSRPFQIAAGLLLSLLFIWLSLRGAPLDEIRAALLQAEWGWVAAYFVLMGLVHVVKTLRWKQLLAPVSQAGWRELNPLAAVGFFALVVLPLRLGELARPYLVRERLGVPASAALASVVVERLIDGLSMGLLLVTLLWVLPLAPSEHVDLYRFSALLITLAFGAGIALLFLAFRHQALSARLVHALLGRLSTRLAARLDAMLRAFTQALDVIPNTRRALEIVLTTALYWLLLGLGLMLVAPAFGFTLTLGQAGIVLGLQVIGAMIPAGPGMTGPFQYATIMGAQLFVGPEHLAALIAYAHVVWAVQFLQQVLFGLYFLLLGKVRLGGFLEGLRTTPAATPASDPAHSDEERALSGSLTEKPSE